ncbi:hypothetical protein E3N88_25675 [Mikania micrantha]|uniref:Uncharacterized protein n=1 Tax=Mikania micrantha TaxID=192012 RepID=A0A5N6N5T3_9ASTR|nr:hypothetical protein E3N88_25675 [Mikania micrantha]
MVNVGENRARNEVTDCPETRNEDKNRKMDENHLGRVILLVPVTRDLATVRHQVSSSSPVLNVLPFWADMHVVKLLYENDLNLIMIRHRPRSRRKCVMKVPAAVGYNMRTAVKGAAYAYDGLNDLNHVMMYVKKSCTGRLEAYPEDYPGIIWHKLAMYKP